MSQVIRAQYRAVIQKEAVPEKTEQAFAYWEEQLKKQCLEGGVLTGTMCRYQDQLFLYLECIAAEEQLADSRRWKAEEHRNRMGGADGLRCCTLKSYFPMYATIRQSLRKACWWEIAIR